ncbi:coiled-coil domain-containing protein 183 [Pterocles gutturalis]
MVLLALGSGSVQAGGQWKPGEAAAAQGAEGGRTPGEGREEQGRKIFAGSCEEKLRENREGLPCLREAVQGDVHTLGTVQKRGKLTIAEAYGEQKHLGIALSKKTVEVAQEKLQADVFARVNKSNLLLYKLQRRSRVIRQLQNSIEKMLTKVHAGQKVTALYLAVRDVLRKELTHLPLCLDLLGRMGRLYDGELEHMELLALDVRKATAGTKADMTKREAQFRGDRELRFRSLVAQEGHVDRLWWREASERRRRAQARFKLGADFPTLDPQDPLEGAELEAKKSQTEHEAQVTEKVEKAKAAAQCSRLWDVPGRLLVQQKSWAILEQHLRECREKKQALKDRLQELELEQAELKFRQPPDTTRPLEEELRRNLRCEEARLEQMRDLMLRNQELLLQFEMGIDHIFIRLQGITVPGQEDSVQSRGVQEKLQQCHQKLRYLVQQVADLPPDSRSRDEDNETFEKVRNLLEKTTANDPQNLKISLEDTDSRDQDPFEFAEREHGLVPTRESIKKQGLQLMESKKKGSRRK